MNTRDLTMRVQARLGKALAPALRRALDRVWAGLREAVDDPEVQRLVLAGRVDAAVDAMLASERFGQARQAVAAELSQALTMASATWQRVVVTPMLGVKLAAPPITQATLAALERLNTQFFPPIFAETRAAFRVAMAAGLEQGLNPRDTARTLREYVGLTEYDARIISTFEMQLRGDPATALTRTLRDHRFDGTLQRVLRGEGTLTEARIAEMRNAYVQRLHHWRAETWSRTAALNATREANLVTWQNTADALGIARDGVEKGWHTTLDGRERPEHNAAHDTWVPMDDLFPVDGGVMTPGDGVYNCRCVMLFRLQRADT